MVSVNVGAGCSRRSFRRRYSKMGVSADRDRPRPGETAIRAVGTAVTVTMSSPLVTAVASPEATPLSRIEYRDLDVSCVSVHVRGG